jgi:maltose alpha-D-glucosyltransferase/alpha-amylase
VIIDFEGEPARNLSERRAKTSPIRDVAGLLRSLSYLTATAQQDSDAIPDHNSETRREIIRRFAEEAQAIFLQRYIDVFAESEGHVAAVDELHRFLDLFLLEKAAYEIAYEARNRPAWLPIPLRGFTDIVSRLLPEAIS